MWITNADFVRAFRKVKAVRDHLNLYHVDGGAHALSVDSLRASVADMYDLEVELVEVAATTSHVDGLIERYAPKRAVILIKASLSDDAKRFTAVKELCHLMIDEEDDWSVAGVETLRLMKVEFDKVARDGEGVENPCKAQTSEYLAWTAAIALMYPCEFHMGDKARVDAEETTIAKLGLYHSMPGYHIESAFNHPHIFGLYADI